MDASPETFAEVNLRFFEQRKYCDVTFTFPNLPDRIEAHKICLIIRSSVFEEIFQNWKSGDKTIEITETTPKNFQQFLKFIYTDVLETNVAGAFDMLRLAHKYKTGLLTKKCEELLKTDIKVKHSVMIFEAANHYGMQDLKDQAGDIMVKNLAFLIGDSSLANAEEDTIFYLLGRDDLTVRECKLFEFVLEWGMHRIAPSDDNQLLKKTLKKLIQAVRYTNMTPCELSSVVSPTGLLAAEEMISVYSYMAADEINRRDLTMKFNTTPRNPEFVTFVDFYAGNADPRPRSVNTSNNPLKLCISFQVRVRSTLWSDDDLKDPCLSAVKVKWPTRMVHYTTLGDKTLNFNLSIKEFFGPVHDQKFIRTIFEKNLLDCKSGHEDEIIIAPPVELFTRRTYCIAVEDQSVHHRSPSCNNTGVDYTYSGMFIPYDLSPEVNIDLGPVDLNLTRIQKDNLLPGFSASTADFPLNMIRGIKIVLV